MVNQPLHHVTRNSVSILWVIRIKCCERYKWLSKQYFLFLTLLHFIDHNTYSITQNCNFFNLILFPDAVLYVFRVCRFDQCRSHTSFSVFELRLSHRCHGNCDDTSARSLDVDEDWCEIADIKFIVITTWKLYRIFMEALMFTASRCTSTLNCLRVH